jgi:predicted small secreted protein
MRYLLGLIVAPVLFCLLGCHTMEGLGQDVESTGHALRSSAEDSRKC